MIQNDLLEQPENLIPNIELELHALQSKLDTTLAEESDIIEYGFSFTSSLKDISRFISISLLELLGSNVNDVLYIINNWQRFVQALDSPDLIAEEEKSLFDIFCSVYYDAIDYFKKQFLSHLGEKVEFESEYIEDAKVRNFVEKTGFRQRKFDYALEQSGNSSIQIVTGSTTRTFEIKKTEREKVEMFNSIFLRFILRPLEAESLLNATASKFPDYEEELFELFTNANELEFSEGDHFIEISPPFENYSYQHDCMVRVYTFNGSGFEVVQYSIPFIQDELNVAVENLLTSFNAQAISTSGNNQYASNNILNNFYFCRANSSSKFLNSFPSLQEYGGVQVLEDAAQIINPKINFVGNKIHPYIVESINSPSFVKSATDLRKATSRYKEIFLSSIATLDVNIHDDNPDIETILQSGELLSAVVNGENASQFLSNASDGVVSGFEVNSDGYCDTVSGTIGGAEGTVQDSYTKAEITKMQFKGNVMSLTKNGDIKLDLMKFIDESGKEKKLFICPICQAKGEINYVDICCESCPNCNVELSDLRVAAESGGLGTFVESYPTSAVQSEDDGGNGIFGVLFDLFGAVFSLF